MAMLLLTETVKTCNWLASLQTLGVTSIGTVRGSGAAGFD